MNIYLTQEDKEHCIQTGHPNPPSNLKVPNDRYHQLWSQWSHHFYDVEIIKKKVVTQLVWEHFHPDKKTVKKKKDHDDVVKWLKVACGILLLLVILFLSKQSHAQFSKINSIDFRNNDNSAQGFLTSPFVFKAGTNCSWSRSGVTMTFNCSAAAGGAGGLATQVQYNSTGSLGGISSMTSDGTVVTAKVGLDFIHADLADATKTFIFDASNIAAGAQRTVNVPNANSTLAQALSAVAHKFLTAMSAQGVFTQTQPVCGDLTDAAGGCTMSTTAGGDLSGTLPSPNVVATHLASPLPENQGGLGTTSVGTNGQVPICNGSGQCPPGDPIVSLNYVNLWTVQDVTVTRTSSTVRVSNFGAYGSLIITWASITGSPSGCTLQAKSADSVGNLINNGSTISVSPANGTTAQVFSGSATLPTQAQMAVVFACSVYPTTGTLTLDFIPAIVVFSPQLPAALDGSGFLKTHEQGSAATTTADGADVTQGAKADAKSTATDTTVISIMQVLKEISFMEQTPASRAVTNAGTFPVQSTNQAATAGTNIGSVTPQPSTSSSDATTDCAIVSAASTNSTNCKGSAGNFYGYEIYNTTTTVYYLRLYNASSVPTCSSATGFIRSIPVPPASAAGGVGGAVSYPIYGVNYNTGIGYCLTGGSSSTDNTNAAVGIFGVIKYK